MKGCIQVWIHVFILFVFKKIKEIEKNKENSLLNERKIIGNVILYSILFYLLIAILYFFIPNDIFDPLIARLLLFIAPVL